MINKKTVATKESLSSHTLQELLDNINADSHFKLVRIDSSCYPYHCILELDQTKIDYKGGHLQSEAAIIELKDKIIPAFMHWAGITDIRTRGFRIVVEAGPELKQTQVHLIAGNENTPLLSQNPQDWLSPPVQWNPDVESAPFFDFCSLAATQGDVLMRFGQKMLYAPDQRTVFGVIDGDPKSETHFLVLASQAFSCILDPGFTIDYLIKFFEVAYALSEQQGINKQTIRLVINTGQGAQAGPRVHLHVQSSSGKLPSMFPVTYGFSITPEGIIQPPSNSGIHIDIIDLIRERLAIKGFSPEAKQARLVLDAQIMHALAQIK